MTHSLRTPISVILSLLLVASTVLMVGCNELAQEASATQTASGVVSPDTTAAEGTSETPILPPGTFSRLQLIEDARQLLKILEDNHPDPYFHGGGKVAFHLRFQDILRSIPTHGMTKEEFSRLLIPFLAAIGDGHTDLWGSFALNPNAPGGIPLRFQIVEQSLYVAGTAIAGDGNLIGSTLVSVEGIPFDDLRARQALFKAIENEYHDLQWLLDSLWYGPYLEDLVPEWTAGEPIRVELQAIDGTLVERTLRTSFYGGRLHIPETAFPAIGPGPYGFDYSVETQSPSVAILRVDDMTRYREVLGRTGGLTEEDFTDEVRAATPSAVETFRQLVLDMEVAGTETLLIDLRNDPGGASIMGDFLIYFLYGKGVMFDVKAHPIWHEGGQIERIGPLERIYYTDAELAAVSAAMGFPLETGDFKTIDHYEFFEDYSQATGLSLVELAALEEQNFRTSAFQDYPDFFEEFSSEEHEAYYTPENVIVLVRPRTFSSGFTMMKSLDIAGATLVGTPSAQSANVFGEGMIWNLDHSGARGIVSHNVIQGSADDPERGRVWPVDVQMTYADLVRHGFDPNTEILLALEWIEEQRRAEEGASVRQDRFAGEVDTLRDQLRIPGLAAGIVQNGELIWSEGFGYADLESQSLVTPETPFGLASVTKPFAAVLLMRLVERDLLDLDTPISEFGIDLGNEAITVRHLFSHTSNGLDPGCTYIYDGGRYSMLSAVIEQLYGDTFRSVLRREILTPLGMNSSILNYGGCGLAGLLAMLPDDDPERAFLPIYDDAATPYAYDENYDVYPVPFPSYANAAAGLMSSVADLAQFARAIEEDALLLPETKASMFAPTILCSGDPSLYALGWFRELVGDTELIWHYGYGAYSTLFLMVPEQGLTFIALANTQNLSRPFGLGGEDVSVLASPLALAFYKQFVLSEERAASLPRIDWTVDRNELIQQLTSVEDPEARDLLEGELWTYRKLFTGAGHQSSANALIKVHSEAFPDMERSSAELSTASRPRPRQTEPETARVTDEEAARWVGDYALRPGDGGSGLPPEISVVVEDGRILAVPSMGECQEFLLRTTLRLQSSMDPRLFLISPDDGLVVEAAVEHDGIMIGTYIRIDTHEADDEPEEESGERG